MASGIYCIKNIINNKIYIGSAVNIKSRWAVHRWNLKHKHHPSAHLQSAWNKYGSMSFKFFILEEDIAQDFLLTREQYWLDTTKCYLPENGYTTRKMADSNFGISPSLETRKKIGNGNRGKVVSQETRDKIKKANTGRKYGPRSLEFRKRVGEQFRGKKHSVEQRAKISKANRGRIPTEKTRKLWSQQRKGKQVGADNSFFGKKHSLATRLKIKEARSHQVIRKGHKLSPEHIQKLKDAKLRSKLRRLAEENQFEPSSDFAGNL